MDDDVVKAHLHGKLRAARQALVWKLDGASDYDIRRPMTSTGTNLLGLVKHNAISDARYFGDVFDRPFPEPLPRWDDPNARGTDHWATESETRADVVGLYRRVWAHMDATIDELDLGTTGYVPWWDETVPLLNVMAARLCDSTRHAGHADILREEIDGAVGLDDDARPMHGRDHKFWEVRRAEIERVARSAGSAES
ncbi:MAG: DinB family protein [Actinomycetota bacterium]